MDINSDLIGAGDKDLGKKMLRKIHNLMDKINKPISFMHVCGTHEYTVAKNGLRNLLPKDLHVVAGPGCPVCVCPDNDVSAAISIAKKPNVILTTFGDMMRVPTSEGSLFQIKAKGADVRIVYGPNEAVELAKRSPDKEIVFFSIGFETTTPLPAVEIYNEPPENFSIVSAHKTVPPAMDLLLTQKDVPIQGFILPGHVCSIIGAKPFVPYAEKYHAPMVVSGFEVNDVLISLIYLLKQKLSGEGKVENTYTRIVRFEGNKEAQRVINEVFEPCDSIWRGIGNIPGSGLKLNKKYEKYDALKKFEVELSSDISMPPGCKCDSVLVGKIKPSECPLFGKVCTPRKPIGPCMVSHEGSCKIAYTFRDIEL